MKPGIRPSTPADAPAIAALLAQVFALGVDHPVIDLRQLHWKYWQDRPDWRGPRSFVLTRGTEVIAHAGLVPGSGAWSAERRRVVHVIDWAAQPALSGAGILLMKHIGRVTDVLLAIGGSAQTLAILPMLGFESNGAATRFVRPLRPLLRLRSGPRGNWRLVPRVVRGIFWTLAAPSFTDAGWHLGRIAPETLPIALPPVPAPTPELAVLERSAAAFAHALACPTTSMALYSAEHAGRVRGYCLLAATPGQVRLADWWIDSTDPADWCALLGLAVREAKKTRGAAEFVTIASDPLLAGCLRAGGFRARGDQRVQLLATDGRKLPTVPLRVQMLDNDAAYAHRGRNEFWA